MNASHPTCVAVDEFEFDKLRIVSENVKVPFCSGIKNGEISISVDGNHGNLTYRWLKYNETNNTFDPLTNQSSNALSALEAGRYMVEVFDGAEDDITNGDSDGNHKIGKLSKEFVLETDRSYELNAVVTDQVCYGSNTGAISVVVAGAKPDVELMYFWTGPNGFTSNELNISNLQSGYY